MPPKTLARLGLALLLAAVTAYFSSGWWLSSRIFTPLDHPVLLDSRQIKSPRFVINLRGTYFVRLHLDESPDDWYEDGRCNYKNVLGSEWRVYRLDVRTRQERELWARSDEMTRRYYYYAGGFAAVSGQYELEYDLPASAACLDRRHPRLMVYRGASDYQDGVALIRICCIFLAGTAAALLALATVGVLRRRFAIGQTPRMFPGMVLRNSLPIVRHKPLAPIHGMPHWGMFCGAVLWILIFVFMILSPLPSTGLFVSWKKRDAVVWEKSPWPDTLEVYVRTPVRFFVNSEEVDRTGLRSKLIEQLGRRAEWTVYFEADPDTRYMDDIYAIETIQACGAKLFWVTPKMREQWEHKSKSPAELNR